MSESRGPRRAPDLPRVTHTPRRASRASDAATRRAGPRLLHCAVPEPPLPGWSPVPCAHPQTVPQLLEKPHFPGQHWAPGALWGAITRSASYCRSRNSHFPGKAGPGLPAVLPSTQKTESLPLLSLTASSKQGAWLAWLPVPGHRGFLVPLITYHVHVQLDPGSGS